LQKKEEVWDVIPFAGGLVVHGTLHMK